MNSMNFWIEQNSLAFADCFHFALTRELGLTQLYSFVKQMHRYPGAESIEPE